MIHRPAFSEVAKVRLDFTTQALADLVEHDIWSDPASEYVWNDMYPDVKYQLWSKLPSKQSLIPPLSIDGVRILCPYSGCDSNFQLSVKQLRLLRTDKKPTLFEACGATFRKSEILLANLRRDWAVIQTLDDRKARTAIKGASVDGKGQPFSSADIVERMRE